MYMLTVACSQTAIYAQGVGLGASKGKDIGKYAEGYSGYVSMAQDSVSAVLTLHMCCLMRAIRLASDMGAERGVLGS